MRRCTKCGKNRALRFYKSARGRVCVTCQKGSRRKSTKDARLQENYDITEAEWQTLLAAQGGVCGICGGKRPMYDVDHDHALEKKYGNVRQSVRGLLCKRCNRRLLPACLDSIEILEAAIAYLRYYHTTTQRILNG